jgi:hypothetical protein
MYQDLRNLVERVMVQQAEVDRWPCIFIVHLMLMILL